MALLYKETGDIFCLKQKQEYWHLKNLHYFFFLLSKNAAFSFLLLLGMVMYSASPSETRLPTRQPGNFQYYDSLPWVSLRSNISVRRLRLIP